jgi:hypothetical protein
LTYLFYHKMNGRIHSSQEEMETVADLGQKDEADSREYDEVGHVVNKLNRVPEARLCQGANSEDKEAGSQRYTDEKPNRNMLPDIVGAEAAR